MKEDKDMNGVTLLGSLRKRALFIFLLAVVIFSTLAAAIRYAIPLDGIPDPDIRRMDSGWFYENGGSLSPLAQLPCQLDFAGDTLYLIHDLTDQAQYPEDVLGIQTRYQSIRVWADQTLIYQAAQGEEYALSSMWHFIPSEKYSGASTLRVELIKYDPDAAWELSSVIQDHPDAIGMYLLQSHLLVVFMWLFCLLFTLMLVVIILFMAIRKIAGLSLVASLAAFIFLSGAWILLDSKITTVSGGNYALTYFFSYCIFYLLPIPLLFYFQLILELKSRFLAALIWITAGNAGLWMLLHLMGVVPIQNTAISVHLIIILFLIAFVRTFLRKDARRRPKRLIFTFWGMLLIFATALVSIILYHAGLLPPSNSAVLYVWSLLALIVCMIMDTVVVFGRVWKERQYMEVYRQLATEDRMTKLANRNAYELHLRELISHSPDEVSFIIFDIDQMKHINDTYGHHVGDQVLFLAAQCIHEVVGNDGRCFRIGGDEFCVILTSPVNISQTLARFDELIRSRNQNPFPVKVSWGWAKGNFKETGAISAEDIVALKTTADQNLYRNKNAHRSTDISPSAGGPV